MNGGTCQKCHCKQMVTVLTSVAVTGEICKGGNNSQDVSITEYIYFSNTDQMHRVSTNHLSNLRFDVSSLRVVHFGETRRVQIGLLTKST